jgi:hypothetical protein
LHGNTRKEQKSHFKRAPATEKSLKKGQFVLKMTSVFDHLLSERSKSDHPKGLDQCSNQKLVPQFQACQTKNKII